VACIKVELLSRTRSFFSSYNWP